MTKQVTQPTKRWIGLSTEPKPESAGGIGEKRDDEIPPASTYLEADTGIIYRWTGTAWVAAPKDEQAALLLQDNNELLIRIVELLELGLS